MLVQSLLAFKRVAQRGTWQWICAILRDPTYRHSVVGLVLE
jgi:hypothetical protein